MWSQKMSEPLEFDEAAFIKEARDRYDTSIEIQDDDRDRAKEDLRFVYEDQWDERDREEREQQGLPCFEINDLPQFISQVAGDVRINRPQINVHPSEDSDRTTADVYEGLIRSVEQASGASRVYADALEFGSLSCGMGHWRLGLEYADDEAFDLDLRIRRISNPLAVIWDHKAQNPDMSDADHCFVIQDMTYDAFNERYPDAGATGYYEDHRVDGYWKSTSTVAIAEYWTVDKEERTLALLRSGVSVIVEELPEHMQQQALQIGIVQSRKVQRNKVRMYMISGREVLEGPFEWPGQRIPIFTVWGRQAHVGDRVTTKSLINNARDSARLYNYAASVEAEGISKAPRPKWLGTAAMFEGNEAEWRAANRVSTDALTYVPDPDSPDGKPTPIMPQPVDPAIALAKANATDDKKRTIGIYDASMGARSNETSGVAIQRRDQQADIANYIFIDNLNLAIEATGREMVAVIPKIYNAPRQLRILGPDMEPQIVAVNQMGGVDITHGKMDVVLRAGPGFNTRRQEAAQFYQRFIETNPQYAPFVAPLVLRNMDYPGYEEFEQVIQQAMQTMMQPPQPTPEQQMDAQKAQADLLGKNLLNQKRFLDMAVQYGPNAFGTPAPVTVGPQPQLTGPRLRA